MINIQSFSSKYLVVSKKFSTFYKKTLDFLVGSMTFCIFANHKIYCNARFNKRGKIYRITS